MSTEVASSGTCHSEPSTVCAPATRKAVARLYASLWPRPETWLRQAARTTRPSRAPAASAASVSSSAVSRPPASSSPALCRSVGVTVAWQARCSTPAPGGAPAPAVERSHASTSAGVPGPSGGGAVRRPR